MQRAKLPLSLLVPVMLLGGCERGAHLNEQGSQMAPAAIQTPLRTVFSASHCNTKGKAVRLSRVDDEQGAALLIGQLSRHLLGRRVELRPYSLDSENLYLLEMGQRPTAGYTVNLAGAEATIENSRATVEMVWGKPAKGGFVAQVVTSPCLVFALPKGRYDTVSVVDAQGHIRASSP